jgi:20S proteasome subunit beta 1
MVYTGRRDGMKREEAERLVKEAVALAMSRDGSSGGVIRCVTVHAGGAERSLVLPEVTGD